jgi:hypothetical protein
MLESEKRPLIERRNAEPEDYYRLQGSYPEIITSERNATTVIRHTFFDEEGNVLDVIDVDVPCDSLKQKITTYSPEVGHVTYTVGLRFDLMYHPKSRGGTAL